MANQTIPITLKWGPISADVSALDINQLGQLVATQLAGSIRADVSFTLFVLSDPTTYVTDLIFNTTQQVFKAWNTTSGKYVPVTQFVIGDIKNSIVGGDQLSQGWVVLDGRTLTAIPGLTGAQFQVLQSLFGTSPTATLPTIVPQNISNLPANGSFSGIVKPVVIPAPGVIGGLPIGAAYDQAEVQALRDDTEILRTSTASVETQTAAIQDKCESLLNALNSSTTPTLYSLLFCGFA